MPPAPPSTEGIRGVLVGRAVFCLALSLAVLSVQQIGCQATVYFAGQSSTPNPPLASSPAVRKTVVLAGQVRSSNGEAIRTGIIVALEALDHTPMATKQADSDGQFEFEIVPGNTCFLRVSAEGFKTFQQRLDEVIFIQYRSVINVVLTPVGQSKSNEAAPAILTDQKAPQKARHELAKGVQALLKEKYPEARAHFEKAIAVYPCYARAQTELAIVLIPSGDFSEAESSLRKSIQCDSGYQQARLVLGQLLNMQKRFGESEKTLSEAVRLAPSSWELYYQLGIAEFGLGKYAKAAEAFEEVLSFNPAPPSSCYARAADAYLAQKTYDKAYAMMEDYLRIDPQGRFAEKMRATIQKMEAEGALTKSGETAAQTRKQ
ncbi:MAG: tetratricopeptide repeat protein [Terriglobia bacterium]